MGHEAEDVSLMPLPVELDLLFLVLGEAIDLFKEGNDADSSHLMLVLHSVLLIWNAATEGRGGEISSSHGRHRYPLS